MLLQSVPIERAHSELFKNIYFCYAATSTKKVTAPGRRIRGLRSKNIWILDVTISPAKFRTLRTSSEPENNGGSSTTSNRCNFALSGPIEFIFERESDPEMQLLILHSGND